MQFHSKCQETKLSGPNVWLFPNTEVLMGNVVFLPPPVRVEEVASIVHYSEWILDALHDPPSVAGVRVNALHFTGAWERQRERELNDLHLFKYYSSKSCQKFWLHLHHHLDSTSITIIHDWSPNILKLRYRVGILTGICPAQLPSLRVKGQAIGEAEVLGHQGTPVRAIHVGHLHLGAVPVPVGPVETSRQDYNRGWDERMGFSKWKYIQNTQNITLNR